MRNDEAERARAYLLKLLKHRPRSRREVMVRLQHKGFAKAAIESAIQKAESADLINDARFAKLWIQDRLARKPKSRRALTRELQSKGLSAEDIEGALACIELDEEALAQRLVHERLPRYSRDDPAERARKLTYFLRRRGFSYGVIGRVLKETLNEKLEE